MIYYLNQKYKYLNSLSSKYKSKVDANIVRGIGLLLVGYEKIIEDDIGFYCMLEYVKEITTVEFYAFIFELILEKNGKSASIIREQI